MDDRTPSSFIIRPLERASRFTSRFFSVSNSLAPVVVLLTVLSASPAAHAQSDVDGDLVPDFLDNCRIVANGPNQTTNQVDSDIDGYGNRCDADYDNDFATTAADFAVFLQCFGFGIPGGHPDCPETDHDGSSTITPGDFGAFLAEFSGVGAANWPGPSGLSCAGPGPCQAYFRRTLSGASNTPGLPNSVVSPTDYDVVTFQVPAGFPGQIASFRMVAGAPGGLCDGGAHCYAEGQYAVAGWADLAEAEASPTEGTLFHHELGGAIQVQSAGTSNGGVPGNPTFPLSLLTIPVPFGSAFCPATGCVVGLIADVSAAPGLVFETRTTSFTPPGTPVDHALCPVGCEGGLPVATASIELILAPSP